MTSTSRIGTLRAEGGRGVVRMEDRFATDPADLWSALTEPERLARWIAVLDGEPRLGGTVGARFTSSWTGEIRIDACEPPSRLVVTSRDGDDGSETVIEATLVPDADGTRLVVEERGLPLSTIGAYGAGWQAHVEDLRAHLTGLTPVAWAQRWRELAPEYEDLGARLD